MGTIWIREFTGGLDLRRLAEASPGGTLIRARDGHITRGGEFQQRADFVEVYTLPAGQTRGLAATPDGLVVFGHQTEPGGIPAGVTYQRLQHPSGEALATVPYATLFRGKVQAIGEYTDDSRYQFFDGTLVSDVNGPPYASGSGAPAALLTQGQKMYVAAGPNLFFSAVADSTDFGAGVGTGEGFIVMSTHAEGSEELTGLARYDEYTAVFARRVIQTWYLDPDPGLSRQAQVLNNTGAIAGRSITQFGDGDVFYLDRSGIRSLRARDSSNSAATTDIGSPIDPDVVDRILTLGDAEAARAIGVIEPRDGRFWLAIRDRIYVFSYFTASKVSAWSEYLPGFAVDDMIVWDDRVWLRSGDTIYVYGGTGDAFRYSADVQAEAWMPYLDANVPFREKMLTGVDAAARGVWEVRVGMDPNNHDATDLVARVDRTTYGIERIRAAGQFNHISLRFKALAPVSAAEPAVLSAAVVHFERDAEEDS